ncbi:3-isopropylmalate dehydratase large subunit [Chloroflexota bacterium]
MNVKRSMTITEKILAKSFGKQEVEPGEVDIASIDVLMVHGQAASGVLAPFAELKEVGGKVWDPDKVVCMWDRRVPPDTIEMAMLHKEVKQFCRDNGIEFHEMGRGGVCHQILPELGYALPGQTIVGSDSHTCTYGAFGCFAAGIGATEATYVLTTGKMWLRVPKTIKINVTGWLGDIVVGKDVFLHVAGQMGEDGALYRALEWTGPVVERMSIDSRMTLGNMSVEVGAKNGIMEPNEETLSFVRPRARSSFEVIRSDPDAEYESVIDIDVSGLEPQIALPYSPANVKPLSQTTGVKIDQGFIGSCTNGRIEDLRMAAEVLKGKKVHPDVRLIVIPASQEVYANALKEGLLSTLLEAGAVICTPSCGPCCGFDRGILAAKEVCIASSNRNFRGRMGDPSSEVYLANAAVVAASSVAGEIADPRKLRR